MYFDQPMGAELVEIICFCVKQVLSYFSYTIGKKEKKAHKKIHERGVYRRLGVSLCVFNPQRLRCVELERLIISCTCCCCWGWWWVWTIFGTLGFSSFGGLVLSFFPHSNFPHSFFRALLFFVFLGARTPHKKTWSSKNSASDLANI